MDYDEERIYYSYQNLQSTNPSRSTDQSRRAVSDELDEDDVDLYAVKRHFREFLRNYRQKQRYLYRDRLLRMHQRTAYDDDNPESTSNTKTHYNPNKANIQVDLAHVGEYDTALLDLLLRKPALVMPPLEAAAADALKTLLRERLNQNNESDVQQSESQQQTQSQTQEQGITQDDNGDMNTNTNGNNDPTNRRNNQNQPQHTFHGSTIQILLRGNLAPTSLRSIQSHHLHTLVRSTGIVISASKVKSRATSVHLRCSRCQHEHIVHATSGAFGSILLPQRCMMQETDCGPTPYAVVPDKSMFVDQQTLKLQEAPEVVPTGEMPRSVLLAVERGLVDRAPPGTRVSVLSVVSLFNSGGGGRNRSVKTVYLQVLGMQRDSGSGDHVTFTPKEEEAFRLLARRSDVYDILSRSIAPSISGSYTYDIKKALTCQLFSGSRKRLPDGMRLRGDINVLLLGDPSMAKSQFLKFITRVSPVGVYTSGKGSSAAGLTASVVRDQRGEFYLEGGAMVLADGGIVAIDEFDKMRPADRVAIHEAMEQQTISVAKAGITTVLNSRSSVLAAANPVFGRYDDMKSASENIDLMTTILSRFDLIFLVRDVRDEELDKLICHHVMGVHINNSRAGFGSVNSTSRGIGMGGLTPEDGFFDQRNAESSSDNASPDAIADNALQVATTGVGELDVPTMKKYIQYCKAKCSPRLSEEAGEILASSYVKIRDDVRKRRDQATSSGNGGDDQVAIPITVRQLEALIRVSESLSKMRLEEEVQSQDIVEALRLFKVSTMAANSTDKGTIDVSSGSNNANSNGKRSLLSTALPSREEMTRTESFLRSRLAVGAIVNKQRIVEEAASQGYDATVVTRVIAILQMRGEIIERNQGRLFKRIK